MPICQESFVSSCVVDLTLCYIWTKVAFSQSKGTPDVLGLKLTGIQSSIPVVIYHTAWNVHQLLYNTTHLESTKLEKQMISQLTYNY